MTISRSKNHGPWTCLSSRVMYHNPWITVCHDEVMTPGATAGIYGTVHFKNAAVGIVALDDEMHTYLVKQFRYTLGRECWEIPMGGGAIDSDYLATAKRELEEETGLCAHAWQEILRADISKSVTDEIGIIYLAQNLYSGTMALEPSEDIEVQRLPWSEVVKMALEGGITDVLSIAAILKVDRMLCLGR